MVYTLKGVVLQIFLCNKHVNFYCVEWMHYNQINKPLVHVFMISFWQKNPACSFLLDSPQVTEINKIFPVSQGNRAALTCPVDGNPPPSVQWYKGNGTSGQPLPTGKTLEFSKVTSNDSGFYTCLANDTVAMVTATVLLKVGELNVTKQEDIFLFQGLVCTYQASIWTNRTRKCSN